MPGPQQDRYAQTHAALRGLQKLTRVVKTGQAIDPVDRANAMGESPSQAERALYGTPEQFGQDIQLRPEEDDSGLSRWIRLAKQGLLFGVKERRAPTGREVETSDDY